MTNADGSFFAQLPASAPSPLVVSVPHAGVGVSGFDGALSPDLDVRCDADLHVDRLYRIGEAGGPPACVAARLSRFVCDLNRHPDDVSGSAVPSHPAPRNTDGRGFIWAVTTTGAPALRRPLTHEEWQARAAIHAAYHGAHHRGAGARARPVRVRDPGRRPLDAVDGQAGPQGPRPPPRRRRARRSRGNELRARAVTPRRRLLPRAEGSASHSTIPTRAGSSPRTTASRRPESTRSRSSCRATSTWTRPPTRPAPPDSRACRARSPSCWRRWRRCGCNGRGRSTRERRLSQGLPSPADGEGIGSRT